MAMRQVLVLLLLAFVGGMPQRGAVAASLSFSLVHRDAPRSLIRREGLEEGISHGVPLRDLLIVGKAMRERSVRTGEVVRKRNRNTARVGVTYLGEIVGDFYLVASVGTPPQELVFIVDTGSELTWTQCTPCVECSKGSNSSFAFNKSSTYRPVPCLSPLCSHSLGFEGGGCSNSSKHSCVFLLAYGDGSEDAGYLSLDTFIFSKYPSSALSKPVVFGCAVIDNDTVPTPSSGLVGLSAGPFSFSSQILSSFSRKSFAYCLPDRIASLNSSGMLQFGDYDPIPNLQYTPLFPPFSPMGDLYYYIGLEGISVGNRKVRVEETALRPDMYGLGGTVLDSGTAVTHLVDPVYKAVVGEMVRQTLHMQPYASKILGMEEVCYNVSAKVEDLPRVPSVTLHLAGGVDVELDYHSLLLAEDLVGDKLVVCLALLNSGSTAVSSMNIIGSYQQQNLWLEYDLQGSRVGISKANCTFS